MARRWGRKRPDPDLPGAQRALEHAREQRAEQDRKREQEREGLIKPMERLAQENHLAGWVLDIIGGNGRDHL